jgi:hypothetical protein
MNCLPLMTLIKLMNADKTKPLKHGGTEEAEETKTHNHEGTRSLKTKDTKESKENLGKIGSDDPTESATISL